MNFDEIENLSEDDISLLYDNVIENFINIAQCACGVDGTCTYNGTRNSHGFCITHTLNSSRSYISEADCRYFCIQNCNTSYSIYWGYRQGSCSETGAHLMCTKSSGSGYYQLCR